jgi:phage tail-like protein
MTMPLSAGLSVAAGGVPGVGGLLPDSVFPYGLAMRFKVIVNGLDLGHWSACKGLKVELKVTRVAEGGNYWFERLLPDRITYPTITLERAVHPRDSKAVQSWLRQVAAGWMNDPGTAGPTQFGQPAQIVLFGAAGQYVMGWKLDGVYPVSWSGPSLSATDNKVAIETLELAHQGFLTSDPSVPAP